MRIVVTEAHIEQGRREDRNDCPIALALRQQTGYPWYVDVLWCGIDDAGFDDEWELPWAAQRFVELFDAGAAVAPFAFELEWDESTEAREERKEEAAGEAHPVPSHPVT